MRQIKTIIADDDYLVRSYLKILPAWKENGFENLKTRFQDCNLSRKQESKPDGMIERKLSFNRESKLSAKKTSCLCGMNENKEARKKTICLCRKETIIPEIYSILAWP